jgi:hypothetical protein
MPPIDVCLISGSRPELLRSTLLSFHSQLIKNLEVKKCIANVDLFGGDERSRGECINLIRSYFPNVEIFTPRVPNLTVAVKSVWEGTTERVVLHLEDDWILLEDCSPERFISALDDKTKAVKFYFKEKSRVLELDQQFDIDWIRKKFLGITISKKPYNRHGTSPGFFDGDFLREWAKKMDLNYDPEKQAKPPWNPTLFEYVSQYRSKFILGTKEAELICDLGREWREGKRLTKRVVNGRSEWKKETE